MGILMDFLEKLFSPKEKYGPDAKSVVLDIPAELYYKELAIYTASSLIGNAISRSEIRTYEQGKMVKKRDYYLLNVSPNRNETSSIFWHKVINRVIRNGEALVVEAGGYLYCADSYTKMAERPILGDLYEMVTVGNFTFDKKFSAEDGAYMFRIDDIKVRQLIDGMYAEYGKILSSAAKAMKQSNGQKYILHIDSVKAGDDEFNEEFNNHITKQLKTYMESDNAVYPEYDGYKLEADTTYSAKNGSTDQYVKLKKDLFSTVAGAFHIPESMMTGNITNMKDIIGSFLTFGADPYADMITETLNKVAGHENFVKGNYYKVDTSVIMHRDAFDVAPAVSNLISSGVKSIDEVREMLGDAPLETDWSRVHFITKNFEEITRFLEAKGTVESTEKGGE